MTTPRDPFEPIVVPRTRLPEDAAFISVPEAYQVDCDEEGTYLSPGYISDDRFHEARNAFDIRPGDLDAVIDALCKARDYQRGMR